ncbi:MAG: PolC-type DNA polymerase III [Peptostreptococcaceae bacterium]|nr:PolC-type DNA polymerase III [Peptostreptococcaceae bacterium]
MKVIKQYLEEHAIEVESIRLYKKEGRLEFVVKSNDIISYETLHELEKQCEERNPILSKVHILTKCIGCCDAKEQIENYLPNIEYILRKFCPVSEKIESCVAIDCKELDDENQKIILNVKNKVVKNSIQSKRINNQIEKSIAMSLGLDVKVVVKDLADEVDQEKFFEDSEKLLAKKVKELSQPPKITKKTETPDGVIKGRVITADSITIAELGIEENNAVLEGRTFASASRKLNKGSVIQTFAISDGTGSIMCKVFWKDESELIKDGSYLKIKADIAFDSYEKEIVASIKDINQAKPVKRTDDAETKRVELHLHSNMSSMDAIESVKNLIKQAKEFGHPAIAITDHGIVQAFPDAMEQAQKSDIKVIYGVEGYFLDDTKKVLKEYNHLPLSQTFVVFDIETTGLSSSNDKITEIGAVKIEDGVIVDRYSQLINPQRKLSPKIIELTGITDEMLADQPTIEAVMPQFMEFVGDAMFVAHNSDFDTGFIKANCDRLGIPYHSKAIDTVAISRAILTDLKSHRLNFVAKRVGIKLENHHRAVDDAQATAEIFLKFLEIFKEQGVVTLDQVNQKFVDTDYKTKRPNHITILAQNEVGLKNLYKIISDSHVHHFYKVPRILKSVLNQYREGLLIGSACESGEVFEAVLKNRPINELEAIISYYDYLEIMPWENNEFMIQKGIVNSKQDLQQINRRIFELGNKFGKTVVATGDVHYIEKHDGVIRDIFKAAQKFAKEPDNGALYFRTTDEMLEEFSYLGEKNAYQVVVENTNKIADMIESFKPIPDGTYPPVIEGSDVELREMCYNKAKRIYGDPLPSLVQQRLDRELNSIIGNGYAVMYIIAQKLVTKSVEDGYLVGSRGSVGSSFAATMSDITEVNPLPPHYVCGECQYSEFFTDGSCASGMDLPDKICPKCGAQLIKEGHDIPFEVFLGFEGDKEPDIDLNFAGEYQSRAHKYTEELFGEDYVFRAGTIGTVAEKTAFGYVMKYMEDYSLKLNNAEIMRLRDKVTGVKRTTGQHPGGVMVVPDYKEIYDFTPIQYPANDVKSGVLTTHFDYHSISGRILKLDILGHDVPTIIKMLEDFTGKIATEIPLDDKTTMSLFTSPKALGCNLSAISCETGTLGIPEFGTKFVRQMLMDTKPTTFAELLQISGLSHGTDVWLNNAQELIRSNIVTLKDVISTRDDIMNYLIQKGLQPLMSFKIMENVRKGKGLTDDHIEAMRANNVPQWYIDSCQKIKYMFPKAHAAAYVMMAFRIAFFKVFHKEAFYAAFFSTKAEDFDLDLILKGKDKVLASLKEIDSKGNEATAKEKNMVIVLEMAYEMYLRGVELLNVDLYRSDATKFKLVDNKLLPPLISIQGLGETVAHKIAEESQKEFFSLEDFSKRTKASKTLIDTLLEHGCLKGLPEKNQLTLF